MTRKTLLISLFVVIIAALSALTAWRITAKPHGDARGKRPDQPLVVELTAAKVQPMPISLQALGQVQSEHSVQIRPQINGMLEEVYFTEGQTVTKGQRLFRLDRSAYETALTGARTAWQAADAQVKRLEPLAGKEYVTTQEYDNARAAAGQLRALLQQAEINLAYTDIRAPITGRTGSLNVKAGNLVTANDATPLVIINQMQPILVQYNIPQQLLPELQRYQKQRGIRVVVTREDGSGELGEGELVFIDNAVNADTGTVTLKARLRNEREQLWPGQYVGVRTQLTVQNDAIVVPQAAIQTGQEGNFVYVVEQGKAAVRPVKVDRQVNDLAVIASGLKGDESIVTRAPRNLRPGAVVSTAADAAASPSARNTP
ncbi:MAG: efflux RND transporter periplasmic adaptor subunit [Pseudomonadota bacterium]